MTSVSSQRCKLNLTLTIGLTVLLAGCHDGGGSTGGAGSGGAALSMGGDTPVTVQRLKNVRLTDIREDLSWKFTDQLVVIDNNGKPIPADLVKKLLTGEATPLQIEATWELDLKAGKLLLSEINVDGVRSEREAALPIAPAGHVRLNLGDRQYNRIADQAKGP